MEPHNAYAEAKKVYDSHNPQYQENWRQWEIISLADLAVAKAKRVKQAVLDRDWEQAAEESIDVMNYESFVWCKVKETMGPNKQVNEGTIRPTRDLCLLEDAMTENERTRDLITRIQPSTALALIKVLSLDWK